MEKYCFVVMTTDEVIDIPVMVYLNKEAAVKAAEVLQNEREGDYWVEKVQFIE
jgi:hypothetical protein